MYGILIVDDNSLVRMSLVNLISWKQHNATLVAIAHDGNEAFRLCEERLPHIVITDIKMPGCDGITLMQKIHRYYPMIQVLAISAHGVFEYAKQAMQAGCLNYILKPISGEELNESIASAIAVIQSRGGRTDEDLYNLYEYALNLSLIHICNSTLPSSQLNFWSGNSAATLVMPSFWSTPARKIRSYSPLSAYIRCTWS